MSRWENYKKREKEEESRSSEVGPCLVSVSEVERIQSEGDGETDLVEAGRL